MCDSRPSTTRAARPRWWLLYAIPALTAAALFAVVRDSAGLTVKTVVVVALTTSAFGAMAWWVRANRAAIDQAEWCGCASSTLRVRVISSAPPAAPPGRERPPGPARPLHPAPVTTGEPGATLSA